MAGGKKAVKSGAELQNAVADLATDPGLEVRKGFVAGRRLWGAEREIDVIVTHPGSRKSMGLECKYQGIGGSAEEKIPATILDVSAWPIPGLVVFSGEGFSANMRSYLMSTGRAVEFEDLEDWLKLFFGST